MRKYSLLLLLVLSISCATMVSEKTEIVETKPIIQNVKDSIEVRNDSINSYLAISRLDLPKTIDYKKGTSLEKAYYDYCLVEINKNPYCFESHAKTLNDYEFRYGTEKYPILYNCDLYFPEEVKFKSIDFNHDGVKDAYSLVSLQTLGANGSYQLLLGFVSNGKTFKVYEISSDLGGSESVEVENGVISFSSVEHAPGDAMCCPSILLKNEVHFSADNFTVTSSKILR